MRSFSSSAAGTTLPGGLIEFNLADIGEGIAECEIIRWFVKPGQQIQQFDKVSSRHEQLQTHCT